MNIQELLDAYLDDELAEDERTAVESALAESPELAAELSEHAAVRSSLRDLPQVEPPAGFFEGMLERGTADPAAELPAGVASLSGARAKSDQRKNKRSFTSRVTSIVAAAAVFLLVLGFGSGISAIERVPALDEFASRHAEALTAMEAGQGAESGRFHAMPMEEMKGMGPAGMDDMAMMGAYETDGSSADKVVQLIYGDGNGSVVSVFRQEVYVDADDMPASESMKMAGSNAWHLAEGEFDTMVVDRDGVTYTIIGDVSAAPTIISMANELPETDKGLGGSIQGFFRGLLNTVGIG